MFIFVCTIFVCTIPASHKSVVAAMISLNLGTLLAVNYNMSQEKKIWVLNVVVPENEPQVGTRGGSQIIDGTIPNVQWSIPTTFDMLILLVYL
jgi:hypothetical protein